MYCMVEQWPVTLEGICLIKPLSHPMFFAPPPTSTLKPQMPPSQMPPAPNHPLRTHRHTERSLFCALKKKKTGSKEAKCLTITIYPISMTIVTIGDKIVEKMFESSNRVLFSNHWKNSNSKFQIPMEANEDKNKCKLPNIQERKKLIR